MFEEIPTPSHRAAKIWRCLCLPFRAGWWLVSSPFKIAWWFLKAPFAAVGAILSFPKKLWRQLRSMDFEVFFDSLLYKIIAPIRWLFSPFIKVWHKMRDAYNDGDWVIAGLWLIPGYFLFAVYRYVILLVFGVGWAFISGIVIWLWNLIAALAIWLWQWLCVICVWLWEMASAFCQWLWPIAFEYSVATWNWIFALFQN